MLAIAALQALLLAVQEHLLRNKQSSGILQFLPPLQVMEALLFQILTLGFIFLTLLVGSSFWSFYPVFTDTLWHKGVLALLAWVVFAILLTGRWYLGWRGRQAIRWTLSGMFFVVITYFGSKFLL